MLASVTAIAAVAAAITGGTYAVFSDRDTVAEYSLTNGTLDLVLTNDGGAASSPFQLGNMQPGDDGSKNINVRNDGSLPGVVKLSLVDLVQRENGCEDPESKAGDTTCDDTAAVAAGPGPDNLVGTADDVKAADATFAAAELASQLQITITGPDGADANDTARDVLYTGLLSNYAHNIEARPMAAGSSAVYDVAWEFVDAANNNLAQGDSVQFDLQFDIVDTAANYTGRQ